MWVLKNDTNYIGTYKGTHVYYKNKHNYNSRYTRVHISTLYQLLEKSYTKWYLLMVDITRKNGAMSKTWYTHYDFSYKQ